MVEDRHIFLQNIVFHFWPKITHPAARSLRDSCATCQVTSNLLSQRKYENSSQGHVSRSNVTKI